MSLKVVNFKPILVTGDRGITCKIALIWMSPDLTDDKSILAQVMAWRRSGDKPLSESMMVSSLTHICVTRPQCVKKEHTIQACVKKICIKTHRWPDDTKSYVVAARRCRRITTIFFNHVPLITDDLVTRPNSMISICISDMDVLVTH